MNGFFQILGGGVVGMAAVLAAQYAPTMMNAPAVVPEVAAPAVDIWPSGTMVLAQRAASCPVGWVDGGAILLGTPPAVPLAGAADTGATNGAILPATGAITAYLCVKGATP